jgi:membrane-bound lytic murein transglycosylase D
MFLKQLFYIGFGLGLILALQGCATSNPPPEDNRAIGELLNEDVGNLDQSIASQIMAEPYHGNQKLKAKVQGEIDRRVWWWLRYFSVRERELFTRNLERGENYRPLVEQILRDNKLPLELYYLALIESGFVNHATSSTSAVGIWQFMKPTAGNYGLKTEPNFDQRKHPIAATLAASRYLSDLHRRFDSWYLAIAAFNAGPGRVNKAIRMGHTRDFWKLANGHFLPEETMEYIPKFLAAATIGNHLYQFGFPEMKAQTPWQAVAAVNVKPGITLTKLARLSNLDAHEILRYNPRLDRELKKSRGRSIRIWLPRKGAETFMKHAQTLVAKVDT